MRNITELTNLTEHNEWGQYILIIFKFCRTMWPWHERKIIGC